MTTPASETNSPTTRPSRRWGRRLLGWSVGLILLLLVIGELGARFYLGLGDPPLFATHPTIEYLPQPGHYERFGKTIAVNEFSMRSGPVTPAKTDSRQLRVLVLGDSVVNGGAQTDQPQLATSILESKLAGALDRPVFVGNVSAGSWGPANQLAYLQKYGLFDADCLVLVLCSHDYADAPTFEPTVDVHPSYPSRRPLLALQELVVRYLLPRLTKSAAPIDPGAVVATEPPAKDVETSMDAIREIIRMARDHGIPVLIAQHPETGELDPAAPRQPGRLAIAALARDWQLDPIDLAPAFKEARDAGQNPHRDFIHPNDHGQQVIADTLYPHVLGALQKRIETAATRPGR